MNELTPAILFEKIRNDKIEASKTRMEESINLLEKSIVAEKEQLKSQFDSDFKAKQEEIHQRTLKMFSELMKSAGREIEYYIAHAIPEKKDIFQNLQNVPKIFKKRGGRIPIHTQEIPTPFEEDFQAIYSDLVADGVNMDQEVILCDGGFLYNGQHFVVGDKIFIAKFSGQFTQAYVELVTTAEITLSFSGNSRITVSKDDLLQHKLVFAHNK